LIKLVIHQELAGRPSHVVGRPLSSASTDFQLQIQSGERAHEANPLEAAKWGRLAREFGRSATLWAHWSVAFAHCLPVSGARNFPCNFLKCSNLTPMFLKSNKH
jgi:hypothetical protein